MIHQGRWLASCSSIEECRNNSTLTWNPRAFVSVRTPAAAPLLLGSSTGSMAAWVTPPGLLLMYALAPVLVDTTGSVIEDLREARTSDR